MSEPRGPFLNRSIEDMQKADHVAQTQDLCRTCKKWYDTGAVHDHPKRPAEERHEFHLLDQWHAYCICGWQLRPSVAQGFVDLGERYRGHLD